jgi:exosortase K
LTRWQIAALTVAGAVVVAGKTFYRSASPDELQWLLAPIAKLPGLVTGARFEYDSAAGWVARDARFVIAPACAGLNFALAAFVTLVVAALRAMRGPLGAVVSLLGAAALSVAATVAVDTARIALAMVTHATGDAHQALGVAVYLGALCALYASARRRQVHAVTA